MGKSQRVKGRAFEQKIARILKKVWPEAARGMQFRGGGGEYEDITNTPYHFELSKGGESIWAKWAQAKRDTKGKPCIVIKQRDREEPMAFLRLETLLELLGVVYSKEPETLENIELILEQYRTEFKTL